MNRDPSRMDNCGVDDYLQPAAVPVSPAVDVFQQPTDATSPEPTNPAQLAGYYVDDIRKLNFADCSADEHLPTDGTERSFDDIEQFLHNGDHSSGLRVLTDAINKDNRPVQLEDLRQNFTIFRGKCIGEAGEAILTELQKTGKELIELEHQGNERKRKSQQLQKRNRKKSRTTIDRRQEEHEGEQQSEGERNEQQEDNPTAEQEDNPTAESGNLEDQIRFCIKAMYPDLCTGEQSNNEFAKKQVLELHKLVKKMVTAHQNANAAQGRPPDGGVEVILKCLQDVFPNRTYYHLLTRWARRSKVDYVKVCLMILVHLVFLPDQLSYLSLLSPPSPSSTNNRK